MAKSFDIVVGSHYFSVTALSWKAKSCIENFARRFVEYSFRGGNRTPANYFALKSEDGLHHSFLRMVYKDFLNHLTNSNYSRADYDEYIRPLYEAKKVNLPVRPKWTDKPHQIRLIKYLDAPLPVKKLATLQTGDGKTYSCIKHNSNKGERYCIIVRPNLMDQWETALTSIYDIEPDRILTVVGGKDLKSMLSDINNDNFDYDVILISNKTLQVWLKCFENVGEASLDLGYDILLTDFFQSAKIAERVIDEVHLDFNFQVRLDCVTHVLRSTSLSATFESDNYFVSKMQKLAYPLDDRYAADEYRKYTKSYAVHYSLKRPDLIRTTEFRDTNYSHSAFEGSVMRYVPLLVGYMKMIKQLIDDHFIDIKIPGKKLAIFAARVEMCTHIKNYIKSQYPQYEVERYTSDDPEENITKADIICTTIGSMGTGTDVPGLVMCILTVAINSSAANKQTWGRLRQIPGFDTLFFWLVCDNVPKHLEYKTKKEEIMSKIALSHTNLYTGLKL